MDLKEELAELHAKEKAIETRIAAIYKASRDAPAAEKLCDDWVAEMLSDPHGRLAYPILVHGITHGERPVVDGSRKNVGRFVAVRPCDAETKGKTFLGVYIGDIALSAMAVFHREGVLEVFQGMHNPAIWVPDLKRIVFGCGSWWGVIEKPEDLRKISDADVENVWYVKALRELEAGPQTAAER